MEQARPRPLKESDSAFEQKEKIIEGGNEIILSLKDKNGVILSQDDILYDGKHYYRIGINHLDEFQMLSCTNGYLHNVQPKDLKSFEKVGTVKNNIDLLDCD